MRRKLLALRIFIAVFVLSLIAPLASGWVQAQTTWPPLDSNCSDGQCVFAVSAQTDDAGNKPNCGSSTYYEPEIYFGRCTTGGPIVSGFRFPNITLSPNVTVTQAYLVFKVDGPYTMPVTITLHGENSVNALTFSDTSTPANRPRIAGISTTWPITNSWASEQITQSLGVTAIIQAIVNKPGWQSGNALAILTDAASNTPVNTHRRVFAYEREPFGFGAARLVIQIVPYKAYAPLVINKYPPPASASYYVTNLSTLEALGEQIGQQDRDTPGAQDRLIILHYGYPRKSSGIYGVQLVFDQDQNFVPITDVVTSTLAFAQKWYTGVGNDYDSHLRIVLGVVNCCESSNPNSDLAFMQGHGTAWAQTIDSIRLQMTTAITRQVDIVAGYDMESEWNRPYASTQWVSNFATQSSSQCNTGTPNTDTGCLYNYGTMPISVSGTTCANSVNQTIWYACDIWYASWGVTKAGIRIARPLPQIYHRYNPDYPQYPWGINATQWKDLSLFSANQMNAGSMFFVGSLTQRARCSEGCVLGNNYPWEGYQLLTGALASNPTTSMFIRWSTDIDEQP